jgi:cytochrome d ubiquinol oxidase subunit II
MSLDVVAAGVVLGGLIAYAVFGGADFGGGVWTALASGPRKEQQREAIFRAMGPVWETNHVWLILVIVTLFTAFPPVFADLFVALTVPLVVALIGIVFRGAAFAFRHYGAEVGAPLPATEVVFSIASVLTPLAMGVALGAVAGGHIEIVDGEVTSGLYEPFVQPFSLVCGLIAVAICGFLTACFMTVRATGELREDFRNRAIAASLMLGALTTVAVPIAFWDAPDFWDRLDRAAPIILMVLAAAGGVASLVVLWQRWYRLAPPIAGATVALVIGAWGAAQYPYVILPSERIEDVAAGDSTLRFLLGSLPIGALILVPSLVLLYWTFNEKIDVAPDGEATASSNG